MRTEGKIPVIIGVTGHRDIRPEAVPVIRDKVREQLIRIKKACPHSQVKLMCSLAEGGDTICAREALSLGIPLIAAIPFEADEFRKDFSGSALEEFNELLGKSECVIVSPDTEMSPVKDRDYLYRQNGIYMASHCHVLLALWDGADPAENACGTSAAVYFALEGDYETVYGTLIRPKGNIGVIRISSPRISRESSPAGEVRMLGDPGKTEGILRKTDKFNALSEKQHAAPDPVLGAVWSAADRLSIRFSEKVGRLLMLLAFLGTGISFSFLMYDEAELHWMLFVCGIMLLLALLFSVRSGRGRFHERYIEYRVLAETERIRSFLRLAGSAVRPEMLMSWTMQLEMPWIVDACAALSVAPPPETAAEISECWIRAQRDYHADALKKNGEKAKLSAGILTASTLVSIFTYLFALVYEILVMRGSLPEVELVRTVVKIVLGTVSAGTLFISGYYGKLSLTRQNSDHAKMERFYDRALEKLEKNGQTEELLAAIVREELGENGNWYSYRLEDSPGFELDIG
ncbi:MAG: DUF4231 domain-containing protein [Oscillospiraceae bacterium]|nr:DUF4231 domain-containing protein [Oscillospiraceae bacterium]